MSPVTITLLVIVIVLAIIIAVLYFLGKKAQKKQAEQQELLDANKQTVSMPVSYTHLTCGSLAIISIIPSRTASLP